VRLAEELEQRGVDELGVRPADVVRAAVDADDVDVRDELGQPVGGRGDRQDPVLRAVDHQGRHVDLREIVAEVGQPAVDADVRRVRRGAGGDLEARLPRLLADAVGRKRVDVAEVVEEALEERVAVLADRRLELLEDLPVDALRVVVALEQERREGSEQHRLADPPGAVAAQEARDLAGAHREAGQDGVLQVEVLEQGVQIRGEGVVVVADGRLAGAPESPAVVADHAVAGGEQRALLALPRRAAQRVPVDEDHGRAAAVVLVVDLDRRAVLGSDLAAWHACSLRANGEPTVGAPVAGLDCEFVPLDRAAPELRRRQRVRIAGSAIRLNRAPPAHTVAAMALRTVLPRRHRPRLLRADRADARHHPRRPPGGRQSRAATSSPSRIVPRPYSNSSP
jgi:hypothetical protein